MDVVGADPVDDPFGLEHREHLRLDRASRSVTPSASVSSWISVDLRRALGVDEVDALEVEHERPVGTAVLGEPRTRSSSASAVAKKRPPSMRRTAMPGNVSSSGFSSRSRKTWVPASRPSSGIGGRVAT